MAADVAADRVAEEVLHNNLAADPKDNSREEELLAQEGALWVAVEPEQRNSFRGLAVELHRAEEEVLDSASHRPTEAGHPSKAQPSAAAATATGSKLLQCPVEEERKTEAHCVPSNHLPQHHAHPSMDQADHNFEVPTTDWDPEPLGDCQPQVPP